MFDLEKAEKIYHEEVAKNPQFDHKLVMDWKEEKPDNFAQTMFEIKYGCHIFDEKLYEKAVACLQWTNDKGKGAKWDVETLVRLSGIDFEKTKFYEYDYAYVANMLWSDYCDIFTDTSYYLKMAKVYLTDTDYPGKADERAYKNAMKRMEYYHKEKEY